MNAFHICGGILAIWAVLVAFLGITREGFPANKGAERIVELVSVVLVVMAIGTAVYTAAHEDKGEGRGEQPEASAALFA